MQCNSCSPITGLRNCRNKATLFCPKCRSHGVDKELSAFCSQKCFRSSWADHKKLHVAAKKLSTPSPSAGASSGNVEEIESIVCESASTQHEFEQLAHQLESAQAKILVQGQQSQEYESTIERLTTEVSNLREEARGDFLAAAEEEQQQEALRLQLENKAKLVEEEYQRKLDLAENECKAAVKLLKSRDEDIARFREEAREQNAESKGQVDELTGRLEEMKQQVKQRDNQLIELAEKHQGDLIATREEITQQCLAEAAAGLVQEQAKAKAEFQIKLTEAVTCTQEERKKEEAKALQSLREELVTEWESARRISEEQQQLEVMMLTKTHEANLQSALQTQESSLQQDHNNTVEALSACHAKKQNEASELLTRTQKEATEAAVAVKSVHDQEVAEMTAAYAALEQKLRAVEDQQQAKIEAAVSTCRREGEERQALAVQAARDELQGRVDQAMADKAEYLQLYTKESKARKAIHNKLMDIQGNIRVMCRVRPVLDVERKQAQGEDVDATEIKSDEDIVLHRDKFSKQSYEFDKVFAPGGSQASVFDAVQPLIISVLDGYNVCIFAYGQTGSGKTFTMEGGGDSAAARGVAPRAIDDLFSFIQQASDNWSYTVKFSMLEIYNETIRDLLVEPSSSGGVKDVVAKLDIRQTSSGNVVTGLTEMGVCQSAEVLDLMNRGQSNRAVGAHDMNEHSSRSHSILTLTTRGVNNKDASTTCGKLHLIDLAGSERVGKTDATGDRLKEAQNINRSLSALGDVINSLGGKKSSHVPYRNSKLTFLLQDSLGGNSKVLMFVNISPAVYNVNESICSLNFAQRCRNVELGQAKKQVSASAAGKENTVSSTPSSSSSSSSRKQSASSGVGRRASLSSTGLLRK